MAMKRNIASSGISWKELRSLPGVSKNTSKEQTRDTADFHAAIFVDELALRSDFVDEKRSPNKYTNYTVMEKAYEHTAL